MKVWFISQWDALRSSFWLVPAVMTAAALVLGLVLPRIDQQYESWVEANLSWVVTTPETAQATLSSITASMVTVAGVVLSITIVALSLTTSQYGSRLLRTFMNDTATQVAIGTFIACSLYCLMVLQEIRPVNGGNFVPHLSVTLGSFSVVVSLGVLIYFMHHTAITIQTHDVVLAVARDIDQAILRMYPERIGQTRPANRPEEEAAELREQLGDEFALVRSEREGYVQAVDGDAMLAIACQYDVVLEVLARPGSFVPQHSPLVRGWPAQRCEESLARKINATFLIGANRTPRQDVEYAISEMVEVAVRAVSPAVNNPFTAMACLDRLGASMARLATRNIPSPVRRDAQNNPRLLAEPLTFSQLLRSSFEQIRYYSRACPDVTLHLLEVLALVAGQANRRADRKAIREEAEIILQSSRQGLSEACDCKRVEACYEHVIRVLESDDQWVRLERAGEPLPPRTLT